MFYFTKFIKWFLIYILKKDALNVMNHYHVLYAWNLISIIIKENAIATIRLKQFVINRTIYALIVHMDVIHVIHTQIVWVVLTHSSNLEIYATDSNLNLHIVMGIFANNANKTALIVIKISIVSIFNPNILIYIKNNAFSILLKRLIVIILLKSV